ncbi:MAG: hypothetical protein NUV97_01085 [archaeon]|nr:hypothetical protein [archaeon]MCR4323444.1 hypothetical protein [Nanoarchaeota archaeon]
MGLFSKKESVPELPPAPVLPDLPSISHENRDLPALPVLPFTKETGSVNKRSAISDDLSLEENEVKVDIPEDFDVHEMGIPKLPSRVPEMNRRRTLELNASVDNKPVTKSMEPIFVRIDKFQASQKNFKEIREKVTDIENVLEKIKGVRAKEEEEINNWSTEVEKLKSRLTDIDSDIFNQF